MSLLIILQQELDGTPEMVGTADVPQDPVSLHEETFGLSTRYAIHPGALLVQYARICSHPMLTWVPQSHKTLATDTFAGLFSAVRFTDFKRLIKCAAL